MWELINGLVDFKMAVFDHNQCSDKRDCIYDEHEAILELGKQRGYYKGHPVSMQKQIEMFKVGGYPAHNGLIFAAVLNQAA